MILIKFNYMKKSFIIYTLFLTIASLVSFNVQAQQKPSERSFAAEINKVKQIQAKRNTMIRQMPQPAEKIHVSNTDKQVTNEVGSNQSGNTNSTTTKEKTQQEVTTKPSAGQMKQPPKPIIPKGK